MSENATPTAPLAPTAVFNDRDCSFPDMARPSRRQSYASIAAMARPPAPSPPSSPAPRPTPPRDVAGAHDANADAQNGGAALRGRSSQSLAMPRRPSLRDDSSVMQKAARAIVDRRKGAASATTSSATSGAHTEGAQGALRGSRDLSSRGPQRKVINVGRDDDGNLVYGTGAAPARKSAKRRSARRAATVEDKENGCGSRCADAENDRGKSKGMGGRRQSQRRSSSTGFGRSATAEINNTDAAHQFWTVKGGEGVVAKHSPPPDADVQWDGSMPRRQSSRGLIERDCRIENRAARTPVEQQAYTHLPLRRSTRQPTAALQVQGAVATPGAPRDVGFFDGANATGDAAAAAAAAEQEGNEPERFDFRRAQSQMAVSNELLGSADALLSAGVHGLSLSSAPEPEARPAAQALQPRGVQTATSATHGDDNHGAWAASRGSVVSSSAVAVGAARERASRVWCGECEGLGKQIAALLAGMSSMRTLALGREHEGVDGMPVLERMELERCKGELLDAVRYLYAKVDSYNRSLPKAPR